MNTTKIILIGFFVSIVSFIATKVHAGDVWFECNPIEIMEIADPDDSSNDRIHVKCSNIQMVGNTDPDDIHAERAEVRFLAIGKTKVAMADRFVNFATTAFACGHIFRALISETGDYNVSGCNKSNCRTPKAFGVSMP